MAIESDTGCDKCNNALGDMVKRIKELENTLNSAKARIASLENSIMDARMEAFGEAETA